MIDVPYGIFAFADQHDSLPFIKKEQEGLEQLMKGCRRDVLDFHCLVNATGKLIQDDFKKFRDFAPCFFHYSGHASHLGLEDGESHVTSALALCAILSSHVIKILFLNGCCTSYLVQQILENTCVEAIIATRCPVNDLDAANVSLLFYERFVVGDDSLHDAYKEMFGRFEKSCVAKTYSAKTIFGEMEDEFDKLDEKDGFAWGLFAKNPEILNVRISNILTQSQVLLEEMDRHIKVLEAEVKSKESILSRVADLPVECEKIEKEIAVLKLKAAQLKTDRKTRIYADIANDKLEAEKKGRSEFESALKNLNYTEQRNYRLRFDDKCVGGAVLTGDKDSVLELLYDHLLEDQDISPNNVLMLPFDPSSTTYDDFWDTLIDLLHMPYQENRPGKKDAITFLIREKFCAGIGRTHKHIVFKIICTNKDVGKLESVLDEFWVLWDTCIRELQLTDNVPLWEHKVLFMFLDETETIAAHRLDIFNGTIDKLKGRGRFVDCMVVLEIVGCMTENDIRAWFRGQQSLRRVGLNADMATEIYQKSNGSIRKILKELKGKTDLNVSLFSRYNIN